MTKIGLLSDTHHYLDQGIENYFAGCDEIWHAGDFGSTGISDALRKQKKLRGVYGNIDGSDIRSEFPEFLCWNCEGVKVLMLHIGGYPPKYNPRSKQLLDEYRPQLFISGHSHILKIQYDDKRNCLHMNPGAAGKQGWHKVRTLIRFEINGNDIQHCEVIELGNR
ncbi:MAG: metallophosphoesterase family protein [Bacteroidota bacterium]|nr:metallophosphoesterase family protein [Bacteroidota bacterium]